MVHLDRRRRVNHRSGDLACFSYKIRIRIKTRKNRIDPAIFNINEPLIFGTPIVLNPILIPPFIIAPLVNGVIAWVATSAGLVNKVTVNAPWTLPGPIGAFLATGGDWRAIVLNILFDCTFHPHLLSICKNL